MIVTTPPGNWRLLVPALLGWGVVASTVTLPGSAVWVIVGTLACVLTCVLAWFGLATRWSKRQGMLNPIVGSILMACAIVLLLSARVVGGEWVRADPEFSSAAELGKAVSFEAALTGFPRTETSEFGERWWVRAGALQERGGPPVLLWLAEAPEKHWAPGMRVEVSGLVEPFAPGDSAAYGVRVLELHVHRDQPVAAVTGEIAAALRMGLREVAAGIPGAELVPGFAVGDTSLVSSELDAAMLESSLTHLTAVSGANCALVTGAAVWLFGRLGAGRRIRLAAAATGLLLFVGVVGPDASVQRAAVMAAVVLVSGFGGKRSAALPALAVAIVVLLWVDPWQALQPGFALSVSATGGVLLLTAPISNWLSRRVRLPRPLALPIAVAVAAQFACGPLLLLLQPGIPAVGILANVLAAPAAPLGTGLGLIAALVIPLSAELGGAAVLIASLPAKWVAATAEVTAELPLGRWHWPEGWTGALLLAACEMLVLLAWALARGHLGLPAGRRVAPRQPWLPQPHYPRAVRSAIAALISTALGIGAAITLAVPFTERLGVPPNWVIVACDVGQGDALILREPEKPEAVMLVDTGDDAELLLTCLERFGVGRISVLVLTHDDHDHVGALEAIVHRVDTALIAPATHSEPHRQRPVVQQLEAAEVPYRIGAAGVSGTVSGNLRWRVIAPPADRVPTDANAASLVQLVDLGSTRVLMLGDTGYEEQRALIQRAGLDTTRLRAHVMKVAHHGSRDQDPSLPAMVDAQWALLSVGAENRHGHPASETLAALARVGTGVLRTDIYGSVALVPDGSGGLTPWVERARE